MLSWRTIWWLIVSLLVWLPEWWHSCISSIWSFSIASWNEFMVGLYTVYDFILNKLFITPDKPFCVLVTQLCPVSISLLVFTAFVQIWCWIHDCRYWLCCFYVSPFSLLMWYADLTNYILIKMAYIWAGWNLRWSMLLLWRLWAELGPEGRWLRLEWSFWMIRIVTSWGMWRDQWERETFSPFLSLREKQGDCARVFLIVWFSVHVKQCCFFVVVSNAIFYCPESVITLWHSIFDVIELAEFWVKLWFGFYVLLFILCSFCNGCDQSNIIFGILGI